MSKPSDYYSWDYDTQRAWDKSDRERRDMEYDLERATEEADVATRKIRAEVARRQSEVRAVREEAAEYAETAQELAEENTRLRKVNDILLAACGHIACLQEQHDGKPFEEVFLMAEKIANDAIEATGAERTVA